MRAAVQAALAGDAAIAAVVGARVYVRDSNEGAVSKLWTPEAFDAEGDVLPTLAVTIETARRDDAAGGDRHKINALVTIAVWAYQQRGYDQIKLALRSAKRLLHRRPLTPVADPWRWLDTYWSDDSAELIDPELGASLMVSRYDAVVVDTLEGA